MFTGPNIVRDGLEFMIDPANEKSTGGFLRDQNMLDYSTWQLNGTSATGFSRNGTEAENAIVSGTGPFGETTLVWETRCDSTSGPDGGWNGSYYSVDSTKTYRLSVWVKRTSSSAAGTFYLGTNGGGACVQRLDNFNSQCNPYWECRGVSGYTQNVWYLVVGHVFPYTYNSSTGHPDSGRYTIADGRIGSNNGCNVGNDMRMAQGTNSLRHRTYHYYSTNNTVRLQFAYPRMDLVDGTEPSVQDLLDGKSREVTNLANRSVKPYLRNNLKIKRDDSFNNRRNHVIDFDGSNDYIETTLSNPSGDWIHSIIFWMRLNTAQSSIGSRVDPFSIGLASNTRYSAMDISNNNVNWYFYNNDTRTSSNLFSANTWYHIALTYTGGGATTSTKTMYINGSKHTWGSNSGANYGQNLNMPANATLNIGRDGGRNTAYFPGDIAKFKVYSNKALTAAQVLRDYNATKGRFL